MAGKLQERGLSACGKQEKGADRGAIFVYKQALRARGAEPVVQSPWCRACGAEPVVRLTSPCLSRIDVPLANLEGADGSDKTLAVEVGTGRFARGQHRATGV
jgi:hypothetical protein